MIPQSTRIAMFTVKIKRENYGKAINLLLIRGGRFQTRHESTLIVNAEQKLLLEQAGLVDNGNGEQAKGVTDGEKTRSG